MIRDSAAFDRFLWAPIHHLFNRHARYGGQTNPHPIREAAKRFVGANKGNVAVIFTIAAIPVISFVGAAIDYSRANAARSAMQSAMDRQP